MRNPTRLFGTTLAVVLTAPHAAHALQDCNVDRCFEVVFPRQAELSATLRGGGREAAPPAAYARASTPARWLGLIVQGTSNCPNAGRGPTGFWSVAQPFTSPAMGDLRRLCVYDWQPFEPDAAPEPLLLPDLRAGGPQVVRVEPDVAVTSPQGSSVEAPIDAWSYMAETFGEQVDLHEVVGSVGPDRVRVAVIDSAPYRDLLSLPNQSRSGHNEGVGSLIRGLGCGGANALLPSVEDPVACPADFVEVVDYLGLPRLYRGNSIVSDEVEGGYFGTQSDVALAVGRAVQDWLEPVDDFVRPGLVVNLSLGWDAAYSPLRPNAQRVAARVAFEAIRHAACQGALVVASAGNHGGTGHTGPLFPAAWERLPRTCPAGAPAPPVAGTYDPLVHAVGAVDGSDRTLAVSRSAGIPRLVAPAAHVAVRNVSVTQCAGDFGFCWTSPTGTEGTEVLTGTSVAAGAVSGMAAFVWALRPDLRPAEVMAILYDTGADLGVPAKFGLGALQNLRRLDACRAVSAACATGAGNCPAADIAACTLERAAGQGIDLDADYMVSVLYPEAAGLPDPAATKVCSAANPCTAPANLPADFTVEPFAHPQPGATNCPLCTLRRGVDGVWRATGRLVKEGITESLTGGWYELTMNNGTVKRYPVSAQVLSFQTFNQVLAIGTTLFPVKGRIVVESQVSQYVSKDELIISK